MTDQTPSPGNNSGMRAYLQDMQDKALRLRSLVEVMTFLEIEDKMGAQRVTLGEFATQLSTELYDGLDSVNVRKVAA